MELPKKLFATLLLACATSSQAQPATEAPLPSLAVGESWKFRVIDLWKNTEVATSEWQITEVGTDRYTLQLSTSPNTEVRTVQMAKDLAPCRTMRNETQAICKGPLRFPMKVGDEYQVDKIPYPNGAGYFDYKCKVAGTESVTVPAGTFDTFRVECAGSWTATEREVVSGRAEQTTWYAPAVQNFVRQKYVSRTARGQPNNQSQTELVQHTGR